MNSTLFNYVGDSGLDARVHAMSIKTMTMTMTMRIVLHMFFTKQ